MIYDLIIIGLGPSGISAGIYAKRQNLNCLVIGKSFGGQMASKSVDIENYPGFEKISGFELIEKMIGQLSARGVNYIEEGVIKFSKNEYFEIETNSGKIFQSKSVIIATGSESRKINIEGEDKFLGKGVSYCTTCDGPLYKNKIVAIAGGGNAGFEAGRFFSKYASKIYIIEKGDKFLASEENQKIVESFYPKIEVIKNADIKKIDGDNFVQKVVIFDKEKEEEKSFIVDGIFIQIGYVPVTSLFKDFVDLNEKGEIIVNQETLETRTPGLFASGDVNNGWLKQIVTACSDGSKAAMSAYKYLNKK